MSLSWVSFGLKREQKQQQGDFHYNVMTNHSPISPPSPYEKPWERGEADYFRWKSWSGGQWRKHWDVTENTCSPLKDVYYCFSVRRLSGFIFALQAFICHAWETHDFKVEIHYSLRVVTFEAARAPQRRWWISCVRWWRAGSLYKSPAE